MGACVIYTGPGIPHLGIVSGTSSVDDVLEAMATENRRTGIEAVEGMVENLSASSITADSRLFDVGSNKSICGAEIQDLAYQFTITPGDERVRFDYDLGNVQTNLPSGFKIVSKSVRGISTEAGTTIASAGGVSGGFEVSDSRLPVTVLLNYGLTTPCGKLELRGSVTLLANDPGGTYAGLMSVADTRGPVTDTTQQELNEMMAAEISLIKREVFYSISQPLDVATTIGMLRKEIEELNSKVKELESR